ncbi:hypothetical protein CAPTEDRAFT_201470 [Capitella teleta]|uniref:Major facilitator superfamily (MFS) profile domain-containing protein n=1 Tax=Capitella teleta TaxID=283909 RepID=R7TP41_CAPTE|nr:hypothetical protein CAPTEDRAFT_201470 [Capitella teleta]|eukprot:ELT95312.1 hypothetical protein CAPTEDRAFT_201470 [Capitella teleta]
MYKCLKKMYLVRIVHHWLDIAWGGGSHDKPSILKKIQGGFLGTYAAEILILIFKIAESMLEPSVRLYIYDSVCLESFPDSSTCSHLSEDASAELQVQRSSAAYIMHYKLLLNLPAMVLVLFCGAWSDRAGRKIPVIITCFGSILAVLLYMSSTYVSPTAPFLPLILIGAAVRGVFGRSAVMTMSLHSYVSDISDAETRTRKISRLVAMSSFGYLIGCMTAGVLIQHYGFLLVFMVVAILQTTCVLFAVTCMRDTVKPDPTPTTCQLSQFKDCFRVLVEPRAGRRQQLFLVAFLIVMLQQTCKSGEMDITLLFVSRSPLNWTKAEYGFLLGTDYACLGITAFFLLPLFMRCCHLKDLALTIMGLICKVFRMGFMAFSTTTWNVYFSVAIGGFNAFTNAGMKSIISKTVNNDELGRTFSLLSCGETVANMMGSVLFATLYSATVDIFPGFAFLVEGGVYVVMAIIVAVTMITSRRITMKKRPTNLQKKVMGQSKFKVECMIRLLSKWTIQDQLFNRLMTGEHLRRHYDVELVIMANWISKM